MPPMRTIPPAKAVKTERTHEENQERAYIAASRRSDRSLEARVESARRASEIHKRRTGRSLRVTEQDVINEEMYEEEDDDLPLQYRRLTAHLQTGSADFNRRLAAYLTNQVAMRSAMEQMSGSSYPQQYPGNPQYPQTSSTMFQSPMLPQHGMSHSPLSSYRAAPYPSPHHPNFRNMHSRAYSTATVPQMGHQPPTPSASSQSLNQRRMSTPSTVHTTSQQVDTDNIKADPDYARQTQSATLSNNHFPPFYQDMHPFTTTLPHEAQQMLGPAFDSNDPFQSMMMHGSDNYTNSPYYPWNDMSNSVNGMPVHPSAYKGMSATLAPAALVSTPEAVSSATTPNTTSGPRTNSADLTAPSSGFDFSMSQEAKGLNIPNFDMSREHSLQSLTSGQVTPGGEGFWNDLVYDGGWSEELVGQ